jgi:hypothetical protein
MFRHKDIAWLHTWRWSTIIIFLLGPFFSFQALAQQTPKSLPLSSFPYTLGYLEYLPPDYETEKQNFPLLIFLHGSGEEGDGSPAALEKVKAWGPPSHIQNGHNMCFTVDGTEECFIVISPQIVSSVYGWPLFVGALIDHILDGPDQYKVDPNRIYLTGLSRGGVGVYSFAADALYNRPNKLAAMAPISCFLETSYDGCLISSREIPVWAFHGKEDTVVPYSFGLNAFISIQNCDNPSPVAEMLFTSYETDGKYHDAWIPAYDTSHKYQNPNLYEWLLKHSRVDVPVAIEPDEYTPSTLIVYPNPSHNEIFLSNKLDSETTHLTIFDMAGKIVAKIETVDRKVDISEVQRGAYIIQLKNSSGTYETARLIMIK